MARFKGSFKYSMDTKGRVALPAPFRKILESEETDEVTAVPGLHNALFLFTEDAFDAWVESFFAPDGGYDSTNERHEAILAKLYSESFALKLDSAGRINIPQDLREKCGLEKDVTIVGARDHMRIFDSKAFEARAAVAPTLDELVFKRA